MANSPLVYPHFADIRRRKSSAGFLPWGAELRNGSLGFSSIGLLHLVRIRRSLKEGGSQRDMLLRFTQILGVIGCVWLVCPLVNGQPEEPGRWPAYVHANGYTYHFAAPGANDRLLGTG